MLTMCAPVNKSVAPLFYLITSVNPNDMCLV